MKAKRYPSLIRLLAFLLFCGVAAAKDKKPKQTGWAEVLKSDTQVFAKPSAGKKASAQLGPRALVAVYESKHSGGADWTQVQTVVPATLAPVTGWVESTRLKMIPTGRFPSDEDLENLLGGEYLEDVNTRSMQIARYLVGQRDREPLLAAYIGATFIPQTRLQVFEMRGGTWTAGPYLEFMSSQLKTVVTEVEVRDLVGDGNDCLVTHEIFAQTFGSSGVNLVIRRIESGAFKTLWQAPLELRNLSSYPPKIKILDPPEKNIGVSGTVSTGKVTYQPNGPVQEPLWKGNVEFHVPGREKPVNTLNVEKACHWDGKEFAPLQ